MNSRGIGVLAACILLLLAMGSGCSKPAVGAYCNITHTVSDVVVQVCDEKGRVIYTEKLKLFSHTLTGENFQRVGQQTVNRKFQGNALEIDRNGAAVNRVTLNGKDVPLTQKADPTDKLMADSLSSDKAVRAKAEAEVQKLSAAKQKDFYHKRRIAFDK